MQLSRSVLSAIRAKPDDIDKYIGSVVRVRLRVYVQAFVLLTQNATSQKTLSCLLISQVRGLVEGDTPGFRKCSVVDGSNNEMICVLAGGLTLALADGRLRVGDGLKLQRMVCKDSQVGGCRLFVSDAEVVSICSGKSSRYWILDLGKKPDGLWQGWNRPRALQISSFSEALHPSSLRPNQQNPQEALAVCMCVNAGGAEPVGIRIGTVGI